MTPMRFIVDQIACGPFRYGAPLKRHPTAAQRMAGVMVDLPDLLRIEGPMPLTDAVERLGEPIQMVRNCANALPHVELYIREDDERRAWVRAR